MAAQTAVTAQHATLSGSTADSVTFSGTLGCKFLRITNRDASNALYFNYSTATVPVAAADDTFYVPPGGSVSVASKGDIALCRVVGNGNAYSAEISQSGFFTGGGSGGLSTTPIPATSGGVSTFAASAQDGSTALTNSAQAVKASAGQLYGYYIYNPNAAASWVVLYDTAQGGVTVGTTNPKFVIGVPAQGAVAVGPGTMGVAFATAISVAAVTTAGGNGAPTTALDTVFWYA